MTPVVAYTAVQETLSASAESTPSVCSTCAEICQRTVINKDDVLATLRAHEAELKSAGIMRLSVFGSVARGETGHDVDLLAAFDDAHRLSLVDVVGLEHLLEDLLAPTWISSRREPSRTAYVNGSSKRPCVPFSDPRQAFKDILENIGPP